MCVRLADSLSADFLMAFSMGFAHLSGVLQPYPCTASVGCQYNLGKCMQLSRTYSIVLYASDEIFNQAKLRSRHNVCDLHISNFKVVISIILQF